MKKYNYLLLLIALIAFSQNNTVIAQEVHTIILSVNTAEVESSNTSITCTFGQEEGIPNEDFTLDVKVGDIIVWKGVSTNAPETDVVNITAVNHEGGVNVFGKNTLRGNNQEPEVVTGVVVQGAPGDVDKYTIAFKVFNDGSKRGGTYHIDPKIQIKPE